jgi:phosphotransferase system enzyme I (PtsI)
MKAIGVSSGIAIGNAFIISENEICIDRKITNDSEQEIANLESAILKGKEELKALLKEAVKQAGKNAGKIFFAHQMILEDPEIISRTKEKIKSENVTAAYALKNVSLEFIRMFENMDNAYMIERAVDVKETIDRLLRILNGINECALDNIPDNSIIIAKELTPRDTILMDKKKIRGIVTESGGVTSHVAILARSLEIPAVTGAKGILSAVNAKDCVVLNGSDGSVFVNPSSDVIGVYSQMQDDFNAEKTKLREMAQTPAVSLDGYRVAAEANIGSLNELSDAIRNGCDGVGLFRTEFIFMNTNVMPSEEEQYIIYREAAEKMNNKKVVFRTLDVGGDKDIQYLGLPHETNPFLGFRAIRFCLKEKYLFKAQLRALLRAGCYGNVHIMLPMISSLDEIRQAKEILEEAKKELSQEGIAFKADIPVGIMIEVPSAALISDILAKEVDFFSIGTNDLMQYIYAVDRTNSSVEYLYNPFHPALLRLIRLVIESGHKSGIAVAMCGEAAANEKLIPLLLGMELDEFSVSSGSLLKIKKIITQTNKAYMAAQSDKILSLGTSIEIEQYLNSGMM